MRRAFVFRLYPTEVQADALDLMLWQHRRLYNAALEHRRTAYRQANVSMTYGQQSAELKAIRAEDPGLAACNFSSLQATLRRLDRAFAAFFRRVKAGEKPGYPRFKGRNRFDSVTFPALGDGCSWSGTRLRLQGVGHIKVKQHRPVDGMIKTVTVICKPDGWHVVLTCDLGEQAVAPSANPPVGIDLGLTSFLATSDGETVAAPKHYRKAQQKLRRLQRVVARRHKGSARRRKAARTLAKHQQHIANQRKDWQYKTALALVRRYGVIVHEDLNIRGIARSRLAKSTLDAAWGQFVGILAHKAEEAGVQVIAVNPYQTSQVCSACGCLPDVPKTLADRVHHCRVCGYTADRDVNAAKVILAKGLGFSLQTGTQRDTAHVV